MASNERAVRWPSITRLVGVVAVVAALSGCVDHGATTQRQPSGLGVGSSWAADTTHDSNSESMPSPDDPNAVTAELYDAQAAGATVMVDRAGTEGWYLSAERQNDRICLRLDAAGRDDGFDDCSTPAHGPWPLGSVSLARTELAGVDYLIGVTTSAVSVVTTTGLNHRTVALDSHLPYPTLKVLVIEASPHPETLQGTSSDGSVLFDVAAPIQ